MARQAISTKYFGPTNTRGSKVQAKSASGHRLMLEWDDALNSDENHKAAALALAEKLEWFGTWACGGTADGYVFVNLDGDQFGVAASVRMAT